MASVDQIVSWLVPIFPQLSVEIITRSVEHPSNQVEPPDEQALLRMCIDDLLVLRTFTEDNAMVDNNTEEVILSGFIDDAVYTPLSGVNMQGGTSSQPIEINDSFVGHAADSDGVIYVESPRTDTKALELSAEEQEQLDIDTVRAEFPDADPAYVVAFLRLQKKLKKADPVQSTMKLFQDRKGLYVKTKDIYVPPDRKASVVVVESDAVSDGFSALKKKASASISQPPCCTVVRDESSSSTGSNSEVFLVGDINTETKTGPGNGNKEATAVKAKGLDKSIAVTTQKDNTAAASSSSTGVRPKATTKFAASATVTQSDNAATANMAGVKPKVPSRPVVRATVTQTDDAVTGIKPNEPSNSAGYAMVTENDYAPTTKSTFVKPNFAAKSTPVTQDNNATTGSFTAQGSSGTATTISHAVAAGGKASAVLAAAPGTEEDLMRSDLIKKNLFPSAKKIKNVVDEPVVVAVGGEVEEVVAGSRSEDGGSSGLNTGPVGQGLPVLPALPEPKSVLQLQTDEVCSMFPDVDPNYVATSLLSVLGKDVGAEPLNWMVHKLLEESSTYPRRKKTVIQSPPKSAIAKESGVLQCPDYFKEYSSEVSAVYQHQCASLLEQEFRRVPVRDIRLVLCSFNYHYAATHNCLELGLEDAGFMTDVKTSTPGSYSESFKIPQNQTITVKFQIDADKIVTTKLLKQGRQKRACKRSLLPELQQEIEFVINKKNIQKEEKDRLIAMSLNQDEYESTGQGIECGCCYGDYAIESMIQCYEGHLFCKECLGNYAKEAVFGEGKAKLSCMSDGCDATFPKSQLELSLPSAVLAKYEDRCQEEAINLADLDDLVRCPRCDFAAIMDPGDKVFKCQNTSCMKETCRYCKEEWEEHFGKPCSEIEKKDETKLRLSYEEKMTMAKIRQCSKCKASFTKSDGCNKMTCRCGAKMCYICRVNVKDYSHFCNHPKSPGKDCRKCKACSLWTNPDEDDDRAVKEIQSEAQKARKDQGFEGDKAIGAPDEPQAKKQKTKHPQQQPPPRPRQPPPPRPRQPPQPHRQPHQQQPLIQDIPLPVRGQYHQHQQPEYYHQPQQVPYDQRLHQFYQHPQQQPQHLQQPHHHLQAFGDWLPQAPQQFNYQN